MAQYKTPAQVAAETFRAASTFYIPDERRAVIERWMQIAVERDRAERSEVDQGWADDAADYGACDLVEVTVTGLGKVNGGYRTVHHYTDFKLTGAQAAGMFRGIGEAS